MANEEETVQTRRAGGNTNLNNANLAKDDEFYTTYEEVEKELNHYAKQFKNKVIYCNCDDHYGIGLGTPKSQFIKYLADNFEAFGIKKVIATHYEPDKSSTMYILDKDNTGDGIICWEDIEEIKLKGNGDFRSEECIKLLQQADIVITNPPFSLFREYVAQLVEYNKKFLIIGNKNAITFKEIFPLIRQNKIWLGFNSPKNFIYDNKPTSKVQGLTRWFTNLPNTRQNEIINTGKQYYGYEYMYPHYDNYDAIEVSEVKNIPMDYDGVMGVPITFLDKHNPEQFEIIGSSLELARPIKNILPKGSYVAGGPRLYIPDNQKQGFHKRLFDRVLIKRKK